MKRAKTALVKVGILLIHSYYINHSEGLNKLSTDLPLDSQWAI